MKKDQFFSINLPYELKLMQSLRSWEIPNIDRIVLLTGISDIDGKSPSHKNNKIVKPTIFYRKDEITTGSDYISFFKPICRPLSDLIKPIEHKGEIFVPMVELAKIEGTYDDNDEEYVEANYNRFVISTGIMEFIYNHNDKSFHLSIGTQSVGVKNQLLLFQKLIEWHFNLMDEGEEFVDVNTLDTNPYK